MKAAYKAQQVLYRIGAEDTCKSHVQLDGNYVKVIPQILREDCRPGRRCVRWGGAR